MSELTIKLRDMMTTLERPDGGAASLLLQAATRIEELEASPANKLQSLGLNQDYEARGIEIMTLRRELSLERDKVIAARKAEDEANKIIEDIAKAAECENFADVILARVAAQNQQSNAMTRICEGHIANCRKAENANARLNQNLSMAQNERDEARGKLEDARGKLVDARGQLQHRSALLHDIADKLGAGSRNAIPARDWYLGEITKLQPLPPTLKGELAALARRHEGHLGLKEDENSHIVNRLNTVLEVYSGINVAHRKYRAFADTVSMCFRYKPASIEELGDMFRGLDIAMLRAKAADYDKVKADAITRIRELETSLHGHACAHNDLVAINQELRDERETHRNTIAARNELIESLRLSELKLSNVANQIYNWQQKNETFVMDDPRDPDWAKQLNAIMCLMLRKENDAKAACEAGKVTLRQLASALGVDPSEGGWHTKMLDKAEHYRRTCDAVDAAVGKFEAAVAFALTYPHTLCDRINALRGFTEGRVKEIRGQQAMIKVLNESLARANSRVSELEHAPVCERMRDLEDAYKEFERCKNRIATANARWNIAVADASNYPQQLDYLIDELEIWRNKATNLSDDMTAVQKDATVARDELDLAVGAIKRMHAKLLENKPRTGIWPADGTFRAKLDDIEWCLYVYIGRVIADGQLHEADTKFISSVRDSLSHEILRRNKQ